MDSIDIQTLMNSINEKFSELARTLREEMDGLRYDMQEIKASRSPQIQSPGQGSMITPPRHTDESIPDISMTFPVTHPENPEPRSHPVNLSNQRSTFGTGHSLESTPVFQSLPKHDHIKPKELTPTEVYKFIEEVRSLVLSTR